MYNMENVSRSIVIVSTIIATVLISSTKETSITAVPGDNKVLQWTLDPLPRSSSLVLIIHPSGDILCSALGTTVLPATTDLGKRVNNTGNTNTVTGHIEFTLSDVTVEDAGVYRTQFLNNNRTTVDPTGVTLIVYGKPSRPTIKEISPPIEETNLTITCETQSNSKPDNHESLQMTYIWYRDGADLPSDDRYVTSGSQLQVKNIQRTDRDTVYTCKAYENVTLTSDVSAGYTVVIRYGPNVVSIHPAKYSYSIATNNDTVGPITCDVDCAPACTYQWKFNSANFGSPGNTLTINNIQRTSAGAYWCVASNAVGKERSKDVIMTYLYGPSVTNISPSNSSYTRVEVTSNTMGPISCIADCNPGCRYQWFRDGQVVSTSAVLTLTGITRSDRGTYLCRAYNYHGGINSTSFNLFVEYGPDPIGFLPTTSCLSHILRENVDSMDEITCTSSCNPVCSYRWERDVYQASNGQILRRIQHIKRGQAGQYVCKVTNKHGYREANVTVVVHYAPDTPVLSLADNTTDVTEDSPITFQCSTQSVPESTMMIYRANLTRLSTRYNTVHITHTIKQASCLDTGLYYCSAENIIGKSTSTGKTANVLCKPRSDHRVSKEIKQTIGYGETMNITGTLISNPPPTIYWCQRLYGSSMCTNLTNNTENFVFYYFLKNLTVSSRAVRTDMKKVTLENMSCMHTMTMDNLQ